MKKIFFFFSIVIFCACKNSVPRLELKPAPPQIRPHSIEPGEDDSVVRLVKFISDPKNKHLFSSQGPNPSDPHELLVVAHIDGKVYFFIYRKDDSTSNIFKRGYLNMEVQTATGKTKDWQDHYLDRVVDMASTEGDSDTYVSPDYLAADAQGENFKRYWQVKYDNAIRELFAYYHIPGK